MEVENPISNSPDWKEHHSYLSSKPELQKYLKNLDNIEVTANKYLSIISDMRLQLIETRKDVAELKDHQKEMIKLIKNERRKRIQAECDSLANCIMIYGLPLHPKTVEEKRKEISKETKEVVTDLFKALHVDLIELGNFDAIRLPIKTMTDRSGKNHTTDGVKLVLTPQGKRLMFTGLSNHGKEQKQIKIRETIAKDLIPVKRIYDKIASYIRKTRSVKTRVVCRKGDITILTKEGGDARFSKIGRKTLEDDLRDMSKDGNIEEEDLSLIDFPRVIRGNLPVVQQTKRLRSDK